MRMMVTMTARLDRIANMANGMWTTVSATSLAYTDLTPMASRIHEGRQSEDCSWWEIVPFLNELFKSPLVSLGNVSLIGQFMLVLIPNNKNIMETDWYFIDNKSTLFFNTILKRTQLWYLRVDRYFSSPTRIGYSLMLGAEGEGGYGGVVALPCNFDFL